MDERPGKRKVWKTSSVNTGRGETGDCDTTNEENVSGEGAYKETVPRRKKVCYMVGGLVFLLGGLGDRGTRDNVQGDPLGEQKVLVKKNAR